MDEKGLTRDEARKRLEENGFNELPKEKSRGGLVVLLEVLREPMLLLLILSVMVYYFLGEWTETLLLSFSVGVVVLISYYQERKTEKALAALKNLAVVRVTVVRDGKKVKIERKEVVVGDLLWVVEGERVGADGLVVTSKSLLVDESLLTGESLALDKVKDSSIFMGTMVVRGEGIVRVTAIGVATEMGKIGKGLETIETEETNLQRQTKQAVRNIGFLSVSTCLILVLYFGLWQKEWIEGVLAGLTAGMALLPEEFPIVMTVFLAIGAWRISQKKVLTRKMSAIEALGAITILCVDKTGTLTENKMSVEKLADVRGAESAKGISNGGRWSELLRVAMMASSSDPFEPMEVAIKEICEREMVGIPESINAERDYSLGRRLTVARGWRKDGGRYLMALKGSPEGVIEKCLMMEDEKRMAVDQVDKMASEGMRVIGVAVAEEVDKLPKKKSDIKYRWLGLLGIKDPIRAGVSEALHKCNTAGIRVIMITGDYPGTAIKIAQDAGMDVEKKDIMVGDELAKIDDKYLRERLAGVRICARIRPEQKLRIVQALKEAGEVVGMTGDGVNDAPALKMADVGVSMGKRGTDVAREASDLVLLDDDFGSLVATVEMGRRIYRNIKKAMMYLISVHIPIAGVSLLPIFIGEQMILLPLHIVLMELIIDPMASVVFETRTEKDLMERNPRKKDIPLFGQREVAKSVGRGVLMLSVSVIIYGLMRRFHLEEEVTRGLMFGSLIVGNLMLAAWYYGERGDDRI